MTWINKTKEEIREDVYSIATEKTGITRFHKTGIIKGLLETIISLLWWWYYNLINPLSTQTNYRTATGFWLTLLGDQVGVKQKQPTKTTGMFLIHAYQSGQIQAGSWISILGTELKYRVVEDVVFNEGVTEFQIEAEFEGADYNITPDYSPHSLKNISGLDKIEIPENWILSYGEDEETDDSLRERISAKWQMTGEGNPPSKYIYHALGVKGVSTVKVIRTPRGSGSTDIIIGTENGLPTKELIENVRTVFEEKGLICRDLLIMGPTEKVVDITVEFAGTYIIEEIESEIRKFFYGLRQGQDLEVRYFYDHFDDFSFERFELITPTRNVSCSDYEQLIPLITIN